MNAVLEKCCIMTITSLISSFQMLRGAVIVFTALLSVAFLRRFIIAKAWLGIAFVICGLATVGISDVVFNSTTEYGPNMIITGKSYFIYLLF